MGEDDGHAGSVWRGMRTSRLGVIWVGLVALGLGPGCVIPAEVEEDGASLSVVCTTGMVADVVRHVGGERVRVRVLMGEGVDPHLYKVAPGDVRAMIRADVLFYSGLHLEGKMGEVLRRLARRKPTVALTEGIDPSLLLHTAEGAVDPHVWFDVGLWSRGLAVVERELAKVDPDHAHEFRRNAEAYGRRLAALDDYCRQRFATLPPSRRVLITAHDAFGYLGRAYGLEVLGIQGLSTETEAGVREINRLVARICRDRIPAVFIESTLSDRNVRALIEGARAGGHPVRIGGELYSDAMGRPGTPEGTYEGMVRHNVETIVRALS